MKALNLLQLSFVATRNTVLHRTPLQQFPTYSVATNHQECSLRRHLDTLQFNNAVRLFGALDSFAPTAITDGTDKAENSKFLHRIDPLTTKLSEGTAIGSGSYGTVHFLNIQQTNGDKVNDGESKDEVLIGKRPWRKDELDKAKEIDKPTTDPKEREMRCKYYWDVEEHCFSKLPRHPQLPPYFGTGTTTTTIKASGSGKETDVVSSWMLFGLVEASSTNTLNPEEDGTASNVVKKPAPSLADLMKLDADTKSKELSNLSQALGTTGYSETLDVILESLLRVLAHVHSHEIVHRDVKPSNLLVSNGTLLMIDFGSAADLEPSLPKQSSGGLAFPLAKRRVGLENGNRVAVSPIYCAPEIFIDIKNHPKSFDLFSSGLVFCQLMFLYLEDRMDAGFHQQLEEVEWDLTSWLSTELDSKVRPEGLSYALEYLSVRPGLWTLLEEMLAKNPADRPSAATALERFQLIQNGDGPPDNSYFSLVIDSLEVCEIPTVSRPLHFVATFDRSKPLGLVLAEAGDDTVDDEMDAKERGMWEHATKDASPGEVFIKAFIPGGQAEALGVLEIGDRLQGVGEIPFIGGGFERAVAMLRDQPPKFKNVRLHFDRLSVRSNAAIPMTPSANADIHVEDRGFWTSLGRRKAQEDAFVLHEIHDTRDRSVLVAGVLDGHGGTAASSMVSKELPGLLSKELLRNNTVSVCTALENAWNDVCNLYRKQCSDEEACVADYDPREGVLLANTGSDELVAGTTISMFALDEMTGIVNVLNCGDSRSMIIEESGTIAFATTDHTPMAEQDRIMKGIEAGLDYSMPQCQLSRGWLTIGAYQYAVARSLEGNFATSKGIVSDADVTSLMVKPGEILVSASDGLWDVMDSEEVALDLTKMRFQRKMSASDAAKALCSMATRKGSPDNVSVVVVYL